MSELLSHLFVWIVSPIAVLGTALYALVKGEFFLGALASVTVVFICGAIALKLFDGYLLAYQLIYGALLIVPVLLGIVAIFSGARQLLNFLIGARRQPID